MLRSVIEGLELRLLYTTVNAQTITGPTTWSLANSPYDLTGNVVVGPGASLTVGSGVVVNGSGLIVASGGALAGTGANFSNAVWVQAGGTANFNASIFSNDLQLDTTAVTTTGNSFQAAVTILPAYVPSLAANGNTLSSTATLDLESSTVSSALTLPVISGITKYNLTGAVTIASGGALTVASGVTLTGSSLIVASGGSITATTDTFDNAVQAQAGSTGSITGSTLVSTLESDTGSLSLTADTFDATVTILPTSAPSLAVGGNTFTGAIPVDLEATTLTTALTLPLITGDPGYDLAGGLTVGSGGALTITGGTTFTGSTLTIASGGSLSASGVTFDNQVLVQTGATGSITTSTIGGTAEFDTAAITITGDTISSVVTVLPTYVPTLAGGGNTYGGSSINLLGATLTAPLTLPLITGVPSYNLVDNLYVGSGAALTIGNGVTLTGATLVVGSGGSLTADAVIFDNSVDVQSGSTGNVSASTFSPAEFDATSLVIGADTFDSTVSVLPSFVPSLASNGNVFDGNTSVNLLGSTINSALTLPVITGVPSYTLDGAVFVGATGALTIASGITVTGSTLTIESGASLTATGDTFGCPVVVQSGSTGNVSTSTFVSTSEFDLTSLIVSGDTFDSTVSAFPSFAPSLGINGNTFPGSPGIELLGSTITTSVEIPSITGVSTYDLVGNVNVGATGDLVIDSGVQFIGDTVTVQSSGSILAVAATLDTPITLDAGSTAVLEYDSINSAVVISGQIVASSAINHNDFSSPSTNVTSEGIGGPINLSNNWWGTTNTAVINAKIEDQNDNPTLPLVTYAPILTAPVVIPNLLATISDPEVTVGSTSEVIAVVYSDATAAITTSTINSTNLIVTSAAGQSLTLTETGFVAAGDKTTVDYAVTPPSGLHWLPTDDGTGTVTINAASPVTDANANTAFSPTINFVVDVPGTAASATSLTASSATATVGATETFTTTVSPAASSSIIPTGVVNYVFDGITLGSATLNSQGQAVFSTIALPAGNDPVVAEYTGDNNYSASDSAPVVVTESALLVSSTTSVSASVSSLAAGTAITFTATIVPGTGGVATPTGTVSFAQNGVVLGVAALQPSGVATLSTSLTPGVDPIIATYSGDGNYAGSTSLPVSVTATSGSVTALTVTQGLIFSGDQVTLTATVSPSITGGVALGGTVEFLDNSVTPLGTATINSAGQAVLTTTTLPVGTDTLTAVYAGQGVYSGSTSQVVNQRVNPTPNASIAVSVSAPSLVEVGEPVTYNVTVTSLIGGAVPTGQVTFSLGTTVLGAATLLNTGTASFTTTALNVGTSTVTVNYGGDATYTQARPVSASQFLYQDGPVPTAVTGTLQPVIAGTVTPGKLKVTVANPSLAALTGQGTINIFATLNGVVDANSILVQSTYVNFKIKPGASEIYNVAVKPLPYSMPSGNYQLLVATSTPLGLFNYSTTGPSVAVTAQVRTFTGSASLLHVPAAGAAISGNSTATSVDLSLTNTGNVSLSGKTTFQVTASTASGVVGTQVITYTLNQSIKPGRTGRVILPLKAFPTLAAGTYYFVVQMTDPLADTFVFTSTDTIAVAARVVTLSASFGTGSFLSASGLLVTITNTGNVEEVSSFTAVAGYSLNSAGTQPLVGRTVTVTIPQLRILPGKSVKVRLKGWSTLSPNIAAGIPYYATLTLTDLSGNTTTAVDPQFEIAG